MSNQTGGSEPHHKQNDLGLPQSSVTHTTPAPSRGPVASPALNILKAKIRKAAKSLIPHLERDLRNLPPLTQADLDAIAEVSQADAEAASFYTWENIAILLELPHEESERIRREFDARQKMLRAAEGRPSPEAPR